MSIQRKAPRVRPADNEPIEIQINGAGFMEILYARDISTEGVGIWVPHKFKGCQIPGEVAVVVTLPGIEPFIGIGMLRHRTPDEEQEVFGIEFTQIANLDRSHIDAYVKRRLAEQCDE